MHETARLKPNAPPRKQARRLLQAIDALAVVYGASLFFVLAWALLSVVGEGLLPDPIEAYLQRSADRAAYADLELAGIPAEQHFDAATGLPQPLLGEASWGFNQLELAVQVSELPLYVSLWFLRLGIGIALSYVAYRAIRTTCAAFAGPWTFTDRGALWVRRLGVVGMASGIALFFLEGMMNRLARNHVTELAAQVRELHAEPLTLSLEVVIWFPIFFFLWLLGGAMHRASNFERQVRETV